MPDQLVEIVEYDPQFHVRRDLVHAATERKMIISIPILLGLGCAVGAFSGLLIVFLRVQPVVVTLAMYFILQGVDLVLSPQPQAMPGNGGSPFLKGRLTY